LYNQGVKEIVSTDGRHAVVEGLLAPSSLVIPFRDAAYVAVLWNCDETLGPDARNEVATALIQSGCRYIVCGGVNCERWHDDADLACVKLDLESNSGGEIPFVMTSWHTDEAEEEVIFFAFNCTNFEDHDFRKFLFLVVGNELSKQQRIERLIESALIG
jgi:hypothetical protein